MRRIVFLSLLLGCGALAWATATPEVETLTPKQREVYERASAKLMAVCCWSETIDRHRSPAAEQMRADVARWAGAGLSGREIVDRFVAEHGERVLVLPEGGKASLLFWTPVAVLLLAAGAGVIVLRRWLQAARAQSLREAAQDLPR